MLHIYLVIWHRLLKRARGFLVFCISPFIYCSKRESVSISFGADSQFCVALTLVNYLGSELLGVAFRSLQMKKSNWSEICALPQKVGSRKRSRCRRRNYVFRSRRSRSWESGRERKTFTLFGYRSLSRDMCCNKLVFCCRLKTCLRLLAYFRFHMCEFAMFSHMLPAKSVAGT